MSAVLNHFGYPAPHLDQWQQHVWYDLGATQEALHQMCIRLSRGLPTITSPLRAKSPPPSRRPAAMPIHPSHGGKFVKASKGESSAPLPPHRKHQCNVLKLPPCASLTQSICNSTKLPHPEV